MTVYVDDMHKHPMGRFGRMKMSHMIADTAEELHAMAARIGVARKWFQGDHYDIALSKRARAVGFGAVEVPLRQLAAMSHNRKHTGVLGDPSGAVALCQAIFEDRRKLRVALDDLIGDI